VLPNTAHTPSLGTGTGSRLPPTGVGAIYTARPSRPLIATPSKVASGRIA